MAPLGMKKHLKSMISGAFLVAEVGLEPHGLRVMSPTSYQLLHSAILNLPVILAALCGAGDRI